MSQINKHKREGSCISEKCGGSICNCETQQAVDKKRKNENQEETRMLGSSEGVMNLNPTGPMFYFWSSSYLVLTERVCKRIGN